MSASPLLKASYLVLGAFSEDPPWVVEPGSAVATGSRRHSHRHARRGAAVGAAPARPPGGEPGSHHRRTARRRSRGLVPARRAGAIAV